MESILEEELKEKLKLNQGKTAATSVIATKLAEVFLEQF